VVVLGREINKGSEESLQGWERGRGTAIEQQECGVGSIMHTLIILVCFFWLIEGKDLIICTYFS
jgi:hypothetical protein